MITILITPAGASLSLSNWDFMGNVLVTPNYIRITRDVQAQRGALWNMVSLILAALFYAKCQF